MIMNKSEEAINFLWPTFLAIFIMMLLMVAVVYGEEVSCQFLKVNDLGFYMVSLMPSGEHELRPDYYVQRLLC